MCDRNFDHIRNCNIGLRSTGCITNSTIHSGIIQNSACHGTERNSQDTQDVSKSDIFTFVLQYCVFFFVIWVNQFLAQNTVKPLVECFFFLCNRIRPKKTTRNFKISLAWQSFSVPKKFAIATSKNFLIAPDTPFHFMQNINLTQNIRRCLRYLYIEKLLWIFWLRESQWRKRLYDF